jgi:L-ascorbate metabolism protein UlaG (beta-lactamase superfamily)
VLRITYVGHATVQLDTGGVRLLTDPVLRQRMMRLRRIVPPPAVEEFDRPDAVLISHAHFDHLDLSSLRQLRSCPALVPRGCGRLLRSAGFEEVTEMRSGERVQVGEVEVTAARVDHDGRRHPFSRARESLAYLVDGSARTLFLGDTGLFEGMRQLAGGIDLALLPIWGWGPRLGRGHMGPAEAADAAALLEARVAIPIHWGTYAARGVDWLEDPSLPARRFEEEAASRAPAVEVRVVPPGGATELRGREPDASWPRSPRR